VVPRVATTPNAAAQIRIGTRGTKLALYQAEQVREKLMHTNDECLHTAMSVEVIETHGDLDRLTPLRKLGSGAFTVLIDQAVADGEVDIGVHSLKDSPVLFPEGVVLACCLPREDPRDAFISPKAKNLGDLPPGSKVGSSSMRRKAQIMAAYPHLEVVPLRGSLQQRLQMLEEGEIDATILAMSGLNRLGIANLATSVLDVDAMLPAACQGVVGVTCREGDAGLKWDLSLITHEPTLMEVACERAVLAELMEIPDDSAQDSTSNSTASEAANDDAAAAENGTEVATSSSSVAATATEKKPSSSSSSSRLLKMPDFAIACNSKFSPAEGEMCLKAMVSSEDGQVMLKVSETVGAARVYDAVELGKKVGKQLRAFAEEQGWYPEQVLYEEEEAAVAAA